MLCGVLFSFNALASAAAQSTEDEAAIRQIVEAQEAAWNAGDGDAYARDVSSEVSFTNLFGMVMYGAPAFAERHALILETFYKGTRKKHSVRKIRFLTQEVAVVDIDNELSNIREMPPGIRVPDGGVLKSQLMQVFAKREGRWIVEAYHNVDVKIRP